MFFWELKLINLFLFHFPTDEAPQFPKKLTPLSIWCFYSTPRIFRDSMLEICCASDVVSQKKKKEKAAPQKRKSRKDS